MQAAEASQTSHRPQVVADPLFSAPAHPLPREGAPLAGKGAAARAVPDGNHGDNLKSSALALFRLGFCLLLAAAAVGMLLEAVRMACGIVGANCA